MTARSVTVRLSADVAGFTAAMGKAAASAAQAGDRIGKAVQGHEQSINTIGNAALGMGAALLAGVGFAVKGFADFDQQMSSVQAATLETDANMARLRETAMQLGADTAFSATEAAQGIEELAKAGVSTEAIIGGGLKGSLDLAAAGQLSVAESAEIAATAMTQFGLAGSDVGHVADLLAAGAGKAQGSVQDMGQALKQSGLVASQYGVSIEETAGALAAFASAGLVGSDAGTSFKTMLMRLAAPTGQAATLMDKLGIHMYDASGEFVGMSDLAGQLTSSMSGMSVEQRNAAMATLFGADAVRAANVLYSQGADGIADWVAAVDEQGYAAETAAAKLDNLKGDLEALGGAFETAMIGMGAGADGPLRSLVQGLTGVVDKFNELPAPIQQGVLAVTAFAGAGALAVGGVAKLVTTAADVAGAFRDLAPILTRVDDKFNSAATSGTKLGTSMRTLGAFAGAAGLALGALSIAGQITNRIFDANTPSIDQYAAALKNLGTVGPDAASAMDEAWAQSGATMGSWTNKVTDLDSALAAFKGNDNWFNGLVTAVGDMAGMDTQLSVLRENFSLMDAALKGMDGAAAGQAFEAIAAKAEKAEFTLAQTMSLFPEYQASLATVAAQLGVTGLSQEEYYGWMQGNVPAAIAAASAATGQSVESLTEQAAAADAAAGAVEGMAGSFEDAAAAAQAASDAVRSFANNMLAQSGSMIGVQAAIDEATASIEKHGQTLDINTEAGRQNRAALDQIAAANLSYVEAALAAGTSASEVTTQVMANREAFIVTAQAAGMNAESAAWLADQYGLIPSAVETQVTAPGADQAKVDVSTLGEAYQMLPPDKQTLVSQMGAEDAQLAVQYLRLTLSGIPPEKAIQMVAEGTGATTEQVQAVADALNGVPDSKQITVNESGATESQGRVEGLGGAVGSLSGKQITVTETGATPATGRVSGLQGSVKGLQGKTVTVSETGASAADGRVRGLTGSINAVPSKSVSVSATTSGESSVWSLKAAIDSVRSKTVTIVSNVINRITGNADGGLPVANLATAAHVGAREFANGGGFTGAGPRRVDRIPAWLAAHEYVQNDRAVDYYGLSVMDALNRRLIPREAFSPYGFASGGTFAQGIIAPSPQRHATLTQPRAGTVVNNPTFNVQVAADDLAQVGDVLSLFDRLGFEANLQGV